jgi:autotransporter-associated beta strand protein
MRKPALALAAGFVSVLVLPVLSQAGLLVDMGQTDTNLQLRANDSGDTLELVSNATGQIVGQLPLSQGLDLVVAGTPGDDSLTVDFTNPAALDGVHIQYDGGAPAHPLPSSSSRGDVLTVTGGALDRIVETMVGPDSGRIALSASGATTTVSYTGLEPIDETGLVVSNRVINLPAGPVLAELTEYLVTNLQLRALDGSFEQIYFAPPANSLTIAASNGDTVSITSYGDAKPPANLNLYGDGLTNTFTLGVSNTLPNGMDVTVNNATLNMNGQTDVIGNLNGNGSITNNSDGTGIMLDELTGTHTCTGDISGNGGLRLRGNLGDSGTQILSGGTCAFGSVRVGRGTLEFTDGAIVTGTATTIVGTNRSGEISGIPSSSMTGTLNIYSGQFTTNAIEAGNRQANRVDGIINQYGGIVQTTGATGDNAGLRVGHWPNGYGFYNLYDGELIIGDNRDLSTAIDGIGKFTQTGGEATAYRVNVNSRTNNNGNGTFEVLGGTFNLGGGGIVVGFPSAPYAVNLGGQGADIVATANWSSSLRMNLFGTGADAITFDTNGNDVALSGALSGTGGLNKAGAGTQVLTGTNTYTGATTIDAGTLQVAGSIAGSVVVNGGWLTGNGTVGGDVDVLPGGGVSAGASPGHLVIAGDYEQAGVLFAEIAGPVQGVDYDWVEIGGSALLGGTVNIEVSGLAPDFGDQFDILTAAGGILNSDLSGVTFRVIDVDPTHFWTPSIVSVAGSAETLRLTVNTPEPTSLTILALGGLGLLGRRRRRR